jgi:FKBP-type peptidyl-prolyl cis-trans isomerase
MKTKKITVGSSVVFLFAIIITLGSCNMSDMSRYEQMETDQINTYLAQHPTTPFEKKASGLYYYEVISGTGIQPATHDSVYLFYTLFLLDGTKIESNYDTIDTLGYVFGEKNVIDGFDEGISYMKAGGKSLFLIPSKLAYGSTGNYYNIGGFTPLLFDVTLARVKKKATVK